MANNFLPGFPEKQDEMESNDHKQLQISNQLLPFTSPENQLVQK